jgi:hypothetical protein
MNTINSHDGTVSYLTEEQRVQKGYYLPFSKGLIESHEDLNRQVKQDLLKSDLQATSSAQQIKHLFKRPFTKPIQNNPKQGGIIGMLAASLAASTLGPLLGHMSHKYIAPLIDKGITKITHKGDGVHLHKPTIFHSEMGTLAYYKWMYTELMHVLDAYEIKTEKKEKILDSFFRKLVDQEYIDGFKKHSLGAYLSHSGSGLNNTTNMLSFAIPIIERKYKIDPILKNKLEELFKKDEKFNPEHDNIDKLIKICHGSGIKELNKIGNSLEKNFQPAHEKLIQSRYKRLNKIVGNGLKISDNNFDKENVLKSLNEATYLSDRKKSAYLCVADSIFNKNIYLTRPGIDLLGDIANDTNKSVTDVTNTYNDLITLPKVANYQKIIGGGGNAAVRLCQRWSKSESLPDNIEISGGLLDYDILKQIIKKYQIDGIDSKQLYHLLNIALKHHGYHNTTNISKKLMKTDQLSTASGLNAVQTLKPVKKGGNIDHARVIKIINHFGEDLQPFTRGKLLHKLENYIANDKINDPNSLMKLQKLGLNETMLHQIMSQDQCIEGQGLGSSQIDVAGLLSLVTNKIKNMSNKIPLSFKLPIEGLTMLYNLISSISRKAFGPSFDMEGEKPEFWGVGIGDIHIGQVLKGLILPLLGLRGVSDTISGITNITKIHKLLPDAADALDEKTKNLKTAERQENIHQLLLNIFNLFRFFMSFHTVLTTDTKNSDITFNEMKNELKIPIKTLETMAKHGLSLENMRKSYMTDTSQIMNHIFKRGQGLLQQTSNIPETKRAKFIKTLLYSSPFVLSALLGLSGLATYNSTKFKTHKPFLGSGEKLEKFKKFGKIASLAAIPAIASLLLGMYTAHKLPKDYPKGFFKHTETPSQDIEMETFSAKGINIKKTLLLSSPIMAGILLATLGTILSKYKIPQHTTPKLTMLPVDSAFDKFYEEP